MDELGLIAATSGAMVVGTPSTDGEGASRLIVPGGSGGRRVGVLLSISSIDFQSVGQSGNAGTGGTFVCGIVITGHPM